MPPTPYVPLDFKCDDCQQHPGMTCVWYNGHQYIPRRPHASRVLKAGKENTKRWAKLSQDPHGS